MSVEASVLAARDTGQFEQPCFPHDSLESMIGGGVLRSGIHSFPFGRLNYDFWIENRGAPITVFTFAAATPRENRVLPIFAAQHILSGLPVNVVRVADPSMQLADDLRLAWYAAKFEGVRVQEVLRRAIAGIADALGSQHNIFFGPSGGGFAALYYAWYVPGSLAFVLNPQTDIGAYDPGNVRRFALAALSARDSDDVMRALHEDTDYSVLPLYAQRFENHILYFQNSSDSHLDSHLQPLREACGRPFTEILGNWGQGHVAPPGPVIRAAMTALTSAPFRDWDEALARLDGMDLTGRSPA